MSETIKLNLKQKSLSLVVVDGFSNGNQPESEADSLSIQFQKQFDDGYKTGYQAALDELEKSYSEKTIERFKDVDKITSELENTITEHENNYERILIQLALLIAEKVIRREVEEKTIIEDVMKQALKRIIGANNVLVKLSPDDYTVITSSSQLTMNDSAFAKIKFEADDRIEQGGCFIESEIGNVDARLTSQMSEIKRNMDAVIMQEHAQ